MSDSHRNYTDGALYVSGSRLYVSPRENARGSLTMGYVVALFHDVSIATQLAAMYNREMRLGPFSERKTYKRGARR